MPTINPLLPQLACVDVLLQQADHLISRLGRDKTPNALRDMLQHMRHEQVTSLKNSPYKDICR